MSLLFLWLPLLLAASPQAERPASSASAILLPDTPPGGALRTFLDEYNAGRSASSQWQRWRQIYGPVELVSIARSEPSRLDVWTRGRLTKAYLGLSARMKEDAPAELDGIGAITGIHPTLPQPLPAVDPGSLPEEVGAYLDVLAREDFFSGAVLVARGERVILSRAWGKASLRWGVDNTPDTRFNIGSITKMFTAVAIAQLAAAGRLSYTDTIRRHLPAYPDPQAETATIHQLLTHTSGIGRGRFHQEGIPSKTIRFLKDWLALAVAPPDFAPGTDVRYSNEAFLLLGAIVEAVSGMDFDRYLHERVYAPAGMSDSGSFEMDAETPRVATEYTRWRWLPDGQTVWDPGPRRMSVVRKGMKGGPWGLTHATAPDLHRFILALVSGRLVDRAQVDRMLQPHVELPAFEGSDQKDAYGYGTEVRVVGGVRQVGKEGSTDGVSCRVDHFPASGFTVVVLSNHDSIGHLVVADYLAELVGRVEDRGGF
jgi:CubicO group peptidase (beta-lactamase class C family)